MEVFRHHLYEYSKGLRNLILHTTSSEDRNEIVECLEERGIDYVIYPVGSRNINVFFGSPVCIEVVKKINKRNLVDYSNEEDFILGVMLGYDRLLQCRRYLGCREALRSGREVPVRSA